MTAPTKTLRTPAEAAIIEMFAPVRERSPASVRPLREAALARFERQGLPHRRVEEWKYSDLRTRLKSAAPPAARPDVQTAKAALKAAGDAFAAMDRYRLVLIDGWFFPELSDVAAMESDGIAIAGVGEGLVRDGLADLMAVPGIAEADIAVALNTAFAEDGVVVRIADNARLAKPIEILHVATDSVATRTARINLAAGAGAVATLIVGAVGGAPESTTNLLTDFRVGEGTALTVVHHQAEGRGTVHLGSAFASLGARAALRYLSVASGGDFARHQLFLTFTGEGARADIFGATMVDGARHIDQTLFVDHAVPGCTSAELFKTAIDGRATAVFQGRIIVRPDAQKTNGKMMSQALLLSEEAQMAAKPELEIFADDVVCGHGATAGQIDDNHLFYLMARGVPRREAERLLIEAFLDEAIDALGDEAIANALKVTVVEWLERRGTA
jgi:Fe-S cluster assembly protein SufD